MVKRIILDTNALMAISNFKIDLFRELENINFQYDLFILKGTIDELKKIIKEQRGKYKQAAKLGLALIKAKKIKSIESFGNVDDELVKQSKKGALVLTQDIGLKRRLHKPYLTIRQKKKIMVVR
tara:strand:- start:247 stop:618 length:372 start_codon:yes stop_codon:yes gene_type:complete